MTNSHDNINKTLQHLYNWITAAEIPGFSCLHFYLVMQLYCSVMSIYKHFLVA